MLVIQNYPSGFQKGGISLFVLPSLNGAKQDALLPRLPRTAQTLPYHKSSIHQSAAPSAPCSSSERACGVQTTAKGSAGRRGSTAADKGNLSCPLPKGRGGSGGGGWGVGEQWRDRPLPLRSATSTWRRRGWRGHWRVPQCFAASQCPEPARSPLLGTRPEQQPHRLGGGGGVLCTMSRGPSVPLRTHFSARSRPTRGSCWSFLWPL